MSMLSIDRLIESISATHNPTTLGLDTQLSHLPEGFRGASEEQADAVLRYNKCLMDALKGVVPCIKVQVAFYELLGVAGMAAFRDTLAYARSTGYVTIADVKRNDIGSTASAYAGAYLSENAPFRVDFITVNAYLGYDGIRPFLETAAETGGGMFVLARTSNPSGGQLQDLRTDKGTLYEVVGGLVSEWGKGNIGAHGYASVGAVVGATYPEEGARLRAAMPHTFFLIPGYGAQGGGGADVRGMLDAQGGGGVINASRSILTAYKTYKTDYQDAALKEAIRMRDDINSFI